MWNAYEIEKLEGDDNAEKRQLYVGKQLYRELDFFFAETWNTWKPEIRKAFTTIAIAHQAFLFKKKSFFNKSPIKGIANWKPELEELEEKGLVIPDTDCEGGYSLNSQIMLTWLTDELIKAGRDDQPFENWLQDKCIDGGFLSVNEKDAFGKIIKDSVKAVSQPATSIIAAICQEITKTL